MTDKHYLAPPKPGITGVSIGAYQVSVVDGVADVSHLDQASRHQLISMKWRAVSGPADGAEPPPVHTIMTAGGAVPVSKETLSALQILQAVELLTDEQLSAEISAAGATLAEGSGREGAIRAVHALRLDAHRAENGEPAASAVAAGAVPDGGVAPAASSAALEDDTIAQTEAQKAAGDTATGATGTPAPGAGGGGETEAVSPRRKRASPPSTFEQ